MNFPAKCLDWKTTGITFYGQSNADDNGLGYTGIDLFKWGQSGTKHNGKPVWSIHNKKHSEPK
jgi:hypothetical protein